MVMNLTEECIKWIKDYFDTTKGVNAVIGISGGKDSAVVAALCKEALGARRVYGVMMPNGVQHDIGDSERVIDFLDIAELSVDISSTYDALRQGISEAWRGAVELSEQTLINLAPRIRMAMLYGIAQSVNGRVANTSNYDELYVGYGTLWGDTIGDFAPLRNLHVSQVLEIGSDLGISRDLVYKAPADGLTGMTDEEKMGFSYFDVENVSEWNPKLVTEDKVRAIMQRHKANSFKLDMIRIPSF